MVDSEYKFVYSQWNEMAKMCCVCEKYIQVHSSRERKISTMREFFLWRFRLQVGVLSVKGRDGEEVDLLKGEKNIKSVLLATERNSRNSVTLGRNLFI